MAVKSWVEEYRINMETGEELEKEKQEALDYEAQWRADNERLHHEGDIMHTYANLLMEKELKALGAYLIKKFPGKENKWLIADGVYYQYGRYYLFNNQPAEAVKWFQKSLRNGVPYPSKVWYDLAAAYVETGEHDKAHYWIQQVLKFFRTENLGSSYDYMNFAKFYIDTNQFERGMAIIQEVYKEKEWHYFDLPIIAKAHFGVGQFQKGFELYEKYLQRQASDEFGFAELALAYYDYANDLYRAEASYLKSVEAASGREDQRHWNHQVYHNLSIIFANEGVWDKCFHYLRLHYLNKYEGQEADMFCQIIDNRPPIEDDDMGAAIYQGILDFEASPVRPGGVKYTEGMASSQPSEEVEGAQKNSNDLSQLFDWDDSISN